MSDFSHKKDTNSDALWEKFLQGDANSYREIYDRYADDLFLLGMRITRDRELVKDCIQDVFVRIFRNRKRLRKTDNVKAYLYIALRNSIYSALKRETAFRNMTEMPLRPHAETPEMTILEREKQDAEKAMFDRLVSGLTTRQREAVHYRYVENLSIEAIAQIMGMNYQSTQNLLQRSIKKAREIFYGK